uniref:Uncharacterized protein n=1 Tax=Arundo donax TaxID=35708 RepID=A0A0A9EHD3_ARUDO
MPLQRGGHRCRHHRLRQAWECHQRAGNSGAPLHHHRLQHQLLLCVIVISGEHSPLVLCTMPVRRNAWLSV